MHPARPKLTLDFETLVTNPMKSPPGPFPPTQNRERATGRKHEAADRTPTHDASISSPLF